MLLLCESLHGNKHLLLVSLLLIMMSQVPYANPPTSQGVSADNPTNLQVMSPSMDPGHFNPECSTQQSVLNRLCELAEKSVNTPIPDDAPDGSGDRSAYMDARDQANHLVVREPSLPPLPQDQHFKLIPSWGRSE